MKGNTDFTDLKLPVCEQPPTVSDVPAEVKAQVADHLQPVFINQSLSGYELQKSIDAINSMAHVFVGPDGKFGRSTACAGHRIDTGDALPVRQRLRRVPLKRRQVIEDYLQDLLAQNCVRPSNSEWATPVVIVAKKDGAPRFCLDYRKA